MAHIFATVVGTAKVSATRSFSEAWQMEAPLVVGPIVLLRAAATLSAALRPYRDFVYTR